VALTLASWPERRILVSMRGWRRGCGPLLPWFRATPFAAAHQYRDRTLTVDCPSRGPAGVRRLVTALPALDPRTLWVFDLPGTLALWLGYELRCRRQLGAALCWNGWYDPRGILDGRAEIPLLLTLGQRLARRPASRGACIVFDARRAADDGDADHAVNALDNRYALNEEDAPTAEQLGQMGIRRVEVYTWHELAADLAGYVDYLEQTMAVAVTVRLGCQVAAHG
jgi:hypothetical protein